MTPRERLAAHLLNMYCTGAGDAGTESAIINFRDTIEEIHEPLEKVLDNGKHTTLSRTNGYSVSMKDHFLMLADEIIADLNKSEVIEARYKEAARQIKEGAINGLLKMLGTKGYSVEEIDRVKSLLDTPFGDRLLATFVSSVPTFEGDPRIEKLVSNWQPKKAA